MGRSNKVRHRFRLFFFKRTLLFLIHHQFLQFWFQCIKKASIYYIISNFPQNCHHNTRKTDKVCDFLQSAKFTCVGDLWTQVRLANQRAQPQFDIMRWRHLVYDVEHEGSIFWVQRSPTQVNKYYHACLVDFSRLLMSPLVSFDVKRRFRHFFQRGCVFWVKINYCCGSRFLPTKCMNTLKGTERVWRPTSRQKWVKLIHFRAKIHHLTP